MSDPSTFADVLVEENKTIQLRRDWLHKKLDKSVASERDQESLDDTIGLSLSGGGIRSATFNLGILQAFAEQRLLSNLDYLSTVSGGGYIGGWLTAWILRDGDVTNVELLLAPDHKLHNQAIRDTQAELASSSDLATKNAESSKSHSVECDPIRQLRASSNYLALRPGFFSIDSWAMVTIYVRNVFLNSLVVVPTVMALIMAVLVLSGLYNAIDKWDPPVFFAIASALLITSAILQQACLVNVLRNTAEPTNNDEIAKQYERRLSLFFYFGVGFLIAAAYMLSLDVSSSHSYFDRLIASCGKRFLVDSYLAQVAILAIMFGLLSGIIQFIFVLCFVPLQSPLSVIWRFFAGFTSGVLGVLLFVAIRRLMTNADVVLASHVAFPLTLIAVFVCESTRTAIICRVESPETREWTSVFQSHCLRFAVGSLALVFLVRYLGQEVVGKLSWTQATTVGVAWGSIAFACLQLARSSGFSGLVRTKWLDYLILVGPPVFLTGCIVLLSAPVAALLGTDITAHCLVFVASLVAAITAGMIVDINVFSLQEMYQSRLVRAFLGASRRRTEDQRLGSPIRSHGAVRTPNSVTQLSTEDDFELSKLRFGVSCGSTADSRYTGPIHLINMAVNYCQDVALEHQERKADSFSASPLFCGATSLGYRGTAPSEDSRKEWWHFWGPHKIHTAGYGNRLTLGRAIALSGAAVSPSMGYYSSPSVTALLTIFNLRLGAWCGNPKRNKWHRYGPTFGWYHLIKETVGATASASNYIYLSDGGHFDNLGVYELLRRRVKYIFVSDAGADPKSACNELGMVLRKATIDFGIHVEMDTSELIVDKATGHSSSCVAIGEVTYPGCGGQTQLTGYLIYMKMTMTGVEPVEVTTYRNQHKDFPHQSTIHQFYSESQFESYRRLGLAVGRKVLVDHEGLYEEGHPRLPPKSPRNSAQLGRFLNIVVANNRWKESADWKTNSLIFNRRYAELIARLVGDSELSALREQVELISSIVTLSEKHLYLNEESTSDWRDGRESMETQLRELFNRAKPQKQDCAEQAWMAEAITLLDDVMTDLNLEKYDMNRTRGWMRVIRIWMNTSAFAKLWTTIEPHFLVARKRFVQDLWADRMWITGPSAQPCGPSAGGVKAPPDQNC